VGVDGNNNIVAYTPSTNAPLVGHAAILAVDPVANFRGAFGNAAVIPRNAVPNPADMDA